MVAKVDRTGEVSTNNFGSTMIISEYRVYGDIDVYFPEYDWTFYNSSYKEFKAKKIKCPYEPRVCGMGYIGEGIYTSRIDGVKVKSYDVWTNMLERCYSETHRYKHPSYLGCSVCDEWLNYQNYAYWYETNYYECDGESAHVDKDIIIKGNRIYSPETCVFVPRKINNLFIKSNAVRGDLPIGVGYHNGNYTSTCNDRFGNRKHLGVFNTPDEAFYAYKLYKEQLIKEIADEYKDEIPNVLYEAMYNYEVEIDD